MLTSKKTINCQGKLLDLTNPIVMGILNVTPDSFYDGNKYKNIFDYILLAEKMLEQEVEIIDMGGMSSRPGAKVITIEEEKKRVLPVIELVKKQFPESIISIDTVHSEVAKAAVDVGADIINDISAGSIDLEMYETVAALQVPYILMHMQGKPETMQNHPNYQNVVQHLLDFFIQEVGELRDLGVKDIIIDVGFGFGKTIAHNYELLQKMHAFQVLDLPILAGISRKSMIYKPLNINPKEALNGTSALHMIALQQGAKILRVHDVQEAKEVIKLWELLNY